MAKAYKLPSGSWRCRPYAGKDASGKRLYPSVTAPTRKQAEMEAALVEYRAKRAPESVTLGDALDKYIDLKEGMLSPATIRSYRGLRRGAYATIIDKRIDRLNAEDFQRAVNEFAAGHSPKTTRNASGLLSVVMKLYAPGFLYKVSLPQRKKTQIVVPSHEEVAKLVGAIKGTHMETALMFASALGLRRSEVSALTWDDIDFKKNTVTVGKAMVKNDDGVWIVKGPKSVAGNRTISMPAPLAKHLRSLKRDGDSVVPLNPNAITERFIRLRNRLGIHCRLHDLRHYYASMMLALGVPDKYAMVRMGHETDTMLKTVYQHLMDDKDKEVDLAINIKLSELFK